MQQYSVSGVEGARPALSCKVWEDEGQTAGDPSSVGYPTTPALHSLLWVLV
jgi:hypothetical protein